ncbi:hypothetical protein F2Q68_00008419 [Brassica cretica]|uniref:Uncharacterized protein n=1 Tax=Brassica cretica TaxID=69181 RepID=A0A8S9L2M6_BRACR|nr:hypothetical protein F2Q68_00008419 [Brassica cretica]
MNDAYLVETERENLSLSLSNTKQTITPFSRLTMRPPPPSAKLLETELVCVGELERKEADTRSSVLLWSFVASKKTMNQCRGV